MRDYAQVPPRFWIDEIGKKLRGHKEGQIVAFYLMSAPGSHMIGMYPLELPTLCHHTGLTSEEARKGLARVSEVGLAMYDEAAELVWVPDMAASQIGKLLKKGDNRIKGIEKELENYRKSKFFNGFIERYKKCFHLALEVQDSGCPLEAPSKPGAGAGTRTGEGTGSGDLASGKAGTPPGSPTWDSYAAAYQRRYKTEPVRNATVNAQLKAFVARIGAQEAPLVAAFYVGLNDPFYVKQGHATGPLLKDAESVRMQWATKKPIGQVDPIGRVRAGGLVPASPREEHEAEQRAAQQRRGES